MIVISVFEMSIMCNIIFSVVDVIRHNLGKIIDLKWKRQCHTTRSEIPARLPLPRLYDIAPSWMQETADIGLWPKILISRFTSRLVQKRVYLLATRT